MFFSPFCPQRRYEDLFSKKNKKKRWIFFLLNHCLAISNERLQYMYIQVSREPDVLFILVWVTKKHPTASKYTRSICVCIYIYLYISPAALNPTNCFLNIPKKCENTWGQKQMEREGLSIASTPLRAAVAFGINSTL